MCRAQQGDAAAYDLFLREVASLTRAFARRRTRHADVAEDVVQETLVSIHNHRHTYDPGRPIGPWIYAIARHRWIDTVRKQRRRDEVEVTVPEEFRDVASEGGELGAWVRDAMTLLSKSQRLVIRMLKLEGHSVAEIANATGLSESSVKVTAHRGYQQLRKLMENNDEE
jgi:RNA polymerase sigma-70 factor (ECF subfamily)